MAALNGPIGIFDSGVGGLSFVQAILEELPKESVSYFADLKNLPYGEKTREQVCGYALDVAAHLKQQQAKLFVIACSTASAVAGERMKTQFQEPVVSVLNPFFLSDILGKTKSKKIGVVSTRLTHQSQMFAQWLQHSDPEVKVYSNPASELVNAISAGNLDSYEIQKLISAAVTALIAHVDVVVLGCTHFNFVEKQFRALLPTEIAISSAPKPTAKYVRLLLEKENLLQQESEKGLLQIETSCFDPAFEAFAAKTFSKSITPLVTSLN